MKYDEKVISWLKLIFFTLVALVFLTFISIGVNALSLSNVTLDQQTDICNVLNLTFTDCYELWSIVENPNQTITWVNSSCNYSDYTLNSDINHTNVTYVSNCSEEDYLTKIDDYDVRGFEPVFEKGIIVNWAKKKNESCEAFDCTMQCSEAVSRAKDECEVILQGDPDITKQNNVFLLAFGGGVLLLVGYFVIKRVLRGKDLSIQPPQSFSPPMQQVSQYQPLPVDQSSYSHPVPQKPAVPKDEFNLNSKPDSDNGSF
jgi:hypothetical protein